MADCHVHNALNWIVCFMTSAQSMENLHIRHVSPMYTHTHNPHTHSTKQKFGDEYFRYFGFLVGIQCIINASIAKLGEVGGGERGGGREGGKMDSTGCPPSPSLLLSFHLPLLPLFSFLSSSPLTVCKFRNLEVSLQPYRLFGILSFVYVGAMVSSNSSLAWITYPTQVCVGRK